VLTSLLYGLAASSALVIGAAIGARYTPPRHVVALLLAFASGALISALAFELFEDAYELGGAARSAVGLFAGAVTFVVADTLLERRVSRPGRTGSSGSRVGLALLAAVTLDGVPENLALSVSLVEGASVSLLVAIFFSNLPESLVGAVKMREGGDTPNVVMGIWIACALLLTAAVVLGRALAGDMSPAVLSVSLGFAGGAVLASLADTLMPEAFERGRPENALATAAGFLLAFVLAV
jgi:zinc transporter, ZIP family